MVPITLPLLLLIRSGCNITRPPIPFFFSLYRVIASGSKTPSRIAIAT